MAGDLVTFETTPKHSSTSNPAESAIQAVEEQSRTIRAGCQMRFGSGGTLGADKPIWAWLLRHAGWQISRYKPKVNGMTAYKQAHGEHYTREVLPFAEIVLVRVLVSRRIVVCKEETVGTRATRCSSRVFGLVEARRRKNTSFSRLEVTCFRERFDDWYRLVDTMQNFSVRERVYRGTHRTVLYRVDRERNLHHHHHPFWLDKTTQSHNPDLPDKTEEAHSETPNETDDTNDPDSAPMSETPLNDGRDASHIISGYKPTECDSV